MYEPMSIAVSDGVNLIDDITELPMGQVRATKNLYPKGRGKLSKRGGLSRPFAQINNADPNNEPRAAILNPISGGNADFVVVIYSSTSTFMQVAGFSFAGLVPVSALIPFRHPRVSLVAWDGKVYILPGPYAEWAPGGSKYPFYIYDSTAESSTSSVSTASLGGTGNENVYPAIALPYKQRLVLADLGRGYENSISFTDPYSATAVTNDMLAGNSQGNIKLVAGADGDGIVGGTEVMLTGVGDPAQAALLILRRYGNPFLLTGEPKLSGGTGTDTLDSKRISIDAGCAGQYTVARTPYGTIWAGPDDVWIFQSGQLPRNIGLKIRPAMKLTPAALQYKWSAAYHDGFYRLAIWGEGQPMDSINAPGDQWWLDLRDGPPQSWRDAKWYGPQQVLGGASATGIAPIPQTWGMIPETRAGKDSKLFYIDRVQASVSLFGTSIGEYGTNTRDTTLTTGYIPDDEYVDPEIVSEIVTKEYDVAPTLEKGNDGVRLTVRPDNYCGLELDIVTDAGDQSQTVSKLIVPGQFRLNFDELDTGLITNAKPIGVSLYAEAGNRPVGQTFQFRIRDVAGYHIVEGVNDTLIVRFNESPFAEANRFTWFATVAEGNYTRDELITALTTAINAAKTAGPNWVSSLNSGILSFEADNSPTDCQIAIIYNTQTQNGVTATEEQVLVCRRLGGMLGFIPNAVDNAGVVGTIGTISLLDATDVLFQKMVSNYDIWGIQANIEVFPREP